MLRFDQATAPACSPGSSSSRLGAERWPSRSTVAFGSLVDDETHCDVGRTGNRQSETVFRDQTAGRPRAGHPASAATATDAFDLHGSGTVRQPSRPSLASLREQQDRPLDSGPGFCVPSQGDNMATARGGARVSAAAKPPDCLLVLRQPEACKQVRDIGDSRDWAASSPRGGRCSTPTGAVRRDGRSITDAAVRRRGRGAGSRSLSNSGARSGSAAATAVAGRGSTAAATCSWRIAGQC